MYVLGITGGIACGKSTVSDYLAKKKVPIIDADAVCHELSQPQGSIWQVYTEHFGTSILQPDKTLDRAAIAARVFADKAERKWMNDTLHPILEQEVLRRLHSYAGTAPVVILDVPLLYEAGWNKFCNEVWVVYVSREIQIQRIMHRDGATREEAKARIAAQMSVEEKCKLADAVIDNRGTVEETEKQVEKLWQKLLKALPE